VLLFEFRGVKPHACDLLPAKAAEEPIAQDKGTTDDGNRDGEDKSLHDSK